MNQELIKWSQDHYSELPWRVERSLYGTLVSEIMLQQTTVGTVLKHYNRFLSQFPDIETLAQATQDEVMLAWQGLGYYRRARSLHAAAIEIHEKFEGKIPLEAQTLLSIKGIGPYTASALRAIGADIDDLAVDANLERVLARYYGLTDVKGIKLQKKIRELFDQRKIASMISELGSRALNEALMDLGRRICQARSAACEICPLKDNCQGRVSPYQYPSMANKSSSDESFELHLLRVVVRKGESLLVYKKNQEQWLSGQFEIPTFEVWGEDTNLRQYPKMKLENYDLLPWIKTGITKYKILNFIIEVDLNEFKLLGLKTVDFEWRKSQSIHLSTTSNKCLDLLDN
ncbi:MAG: hypothetical protein CME65_10630 [Halobacteriovoraceae bacterium]|nr:hypothetical protein [Halobacteriovoraceae bacterium]|tara:strand:+ start:5866 stop:6897 length:1032 start_codon:yes stop_codon:yes gene_type:complete